MKRTSKRWQLGLAAVAVACVVGLTGCAETISGHEGTTIEETSDVEWNGRILERFAPRPLPDTTSSQQTPPVGL